MKKRLMAAVILFGCFFAGNKMQPTALNTDLPLSVSEKYVAETLYLLVGSYSEGDTPGISIYGLNLQTGDFKYVSDVKAVVNPSYLTVSPDEKFVYAVNETAAGAVSAFAFDKTNGVLRFINRQPVGGGDPCYITVDQAATALITANYSGGNLSVLLLEKNGSVGKLTQNIRFSPESHIHTAVFSPGEKQLWATDLGEDCIYTFEVTQKENHFFLKQLPEKTIRLEPGSGPRHLAIHPDQNTVYCINELSGKITVFKTGETGALSPIQYIAADTTSGTGRKGSADIHLSPDGRFLYASNRLKADGIAIFSIHPGDGRLTFAGYQPTDIHPRNFTISPNGKFLLCANRDSHTVQIFAVDSLTGQLQDTGKIISLPRPVCLKWLGKLLVND
ncbi:MAG: lactonase family protein [Dysgonamonadaceae bacterium]|jgi:6-phosphogluconolactonase (cycloisomerase 2 family)|nr:lactonase family protein [Dysgonamonadaceae bacterium]